MSGAVATTSATATATATVVTPALTTTFTPTATGCIKNQLTMLANREFEIWLNMPLPVLGTTMSECYPSQFMSSFLQSAGGITQAAFNPLVCPQSYSAVGPFTSNYIACCPSGYSLAPPKETVFSDRPAFGGTCYTPLTSGKAVQVTQYGSSGVTATSTFMPTVTNAQAYAYPYEGYAFGVQQVISIESGVSSTIAVGSSSASSTAAAAAPTSAGSGATYTILAAAGPTFIPNSVNAKVGDKLLFQFSSGNHSLTQSTFDSPCTPLLNGFDSGYMGSSAAEIPLSVNVSTAQFFYSKQGSDCSEGMAFALNPTTAQSATNFHAAAIARSSPSSSGLTTGAKAGIAMGCIAGFGFLLLVALFFLRKRGGHRGDNEMDTFSKQPEYGSSRGGPSPSTLASSPPIGGLRNGVTPINTSPAGSMHQRGMIEEIRPHPPPKGEELHGISSPTELAQHNQRPVELAGSDGLHFAVSEKDEDYTPQTSISGGTFGMSPRDQKDDIANAAELMSPHTAREDYNTRRWEEVTPSTGTFDNTGTFNSHRSDSTASDIYSNPDRRGPSPRYER